MDLHSGKIRQVTTSPALLVGMGSVSPDGKWIAEATQRNHGQRYDQTFNQIWLLSDHGQASPLDENEAEGRAPKLSPDGNKIPFESTRGSPEPVAYAVFVADKDGKHVKRLTTFSSNAQHPAWSPDGKWIAFSARQAKAREFGPGIALMPAS